jgi:hypothetical protein
MALRPPAFLDGLATGHREGDYLFVYAGIRPGLPIDCQTEDDLLGIRQSFLASEQDFRVVVVHGHTTTPTPAIKANRISIATGPGHRRRLTCGVRAGWHRVHAGRITSSKVGGATASSAGAWRSIPAPHSTRLRPKGDAK